MSEQTPRHAAMRFESESDAHDALSQWAERRAFLDTERDPLVAGALAAGVKPVEINRIAGIATSTIARIPDLPTAAPQPPVFEYRSILSARVERYFAEDAEDISIAPTAIAGKARMARAALQILKTGLPDGRWQSDDALLLHLIITMQHQVRSLGTNAPTTPWNQGASAEAQQIIHEARAIRERGHDALQDLDPRDRDHAKASARETDLAMRASLIGSTPEAVAAMSDEQFAEAIRTADDAQQYDQ